MKSHMRFDVLTLFPELIEQINGSSIIGRAKEAGILAIRTHNIRDFAENKWHRVDDTPAGGGKGMLIAAPPVYNCWKSVRDSIPEGCRVHTVYMSPQGKVLTQKKAQELLSYDNLILLCGHYEGIDERVLEEIVDEEISVGDYVLTGGELPACILIDCVSRLVDGVLASPECYEDESIASGLLEYPQYTRPNVFHGKEIPPVLLSGDHKKVAIWRYEAAVARTKKKRPDLIRDCIPPFLWKRSETYGTASKNTQVNTTGDGKSN